MSQQSFIKGTILHSSAGSFAEAVRLIRKEMGAKPIHADEIIDSEWVEPANCYPTPVEMPVIKAIAAEGTLSKAAQGYSSPQERRFLTRDQVRANAGHPAFAPFPA